jgi:Predicted nucleotidyltransferase
MKVTAVIAEYNPFHNGHLYQLNTIRHTENADIILVIMGGNFMQRGIPAIVNKYERCRMALLHGADLVFELPVYFALGSAEYFAQGAVSLADKLGVVESLHFGSESGNISQILQYAHTLASESDAYKTALNRHLKQGCSFPAARSNALSELFPNQDTQNFLSASNNILGVEYVKALIQRNSAIKPATLTRKGAAYTSVNIESDSFISANAIRNALLHQSLNNIVTSPVQNHMPVDIYTLLQNKEHLYAEDFSGILLYKMLQLYGHKDVYANYFDIGRQLSHTLHNNLSRFVSFEKFALLCKTKNLTYSRICRGLMHILLGLTQECADALKERDYTPYARLLGFTPCGQNLLKSIKANASIPIITKPAHALKHLSDIALTSLQSDIFAANIYESVLQQKKRCQPANTASLLRQSELTCELIKVNF